MIYRKKKIKLAVVGLGYVGLPLALEFAKKRKVIGFDISVKRIKELKSSLDINLEFSKKEFQDSKFIKFTNNINDLRSSNIYIITVPTPIDKFKKPDLKYLTTSSKMIGRILKKNDIVVYESTVYPGCVEEVCIPILEKYSKLLFNKDFFCGYSPERINPGDKKHKLSNVKKIISGSNLKISEYLKKLYDEIIDAGTHKVSSIKVAEAAKVIENIQRDVNIAFINEISMILSKMNIDTQEVLDAAKTKWNFLLFKPGLVGGHCIGIDPYYLIHKSKSIGYVPKIILQSRNINENMSSYCILRFLKKMKEKKLN